MFTMFAQSAQEATQLISTDIDYWWNVPNKSSLPTKDKILWHGKALWFHAYSHFKKSNLGFDKNGMDYSISHLNKDFEQDKQACETLWFDNDKYDSSYRHDYKCEQAEFGELAQNNNCTINKTTEKVATALCQQQ